MRDEFDPVKTFNNFVKSWWKIVVIAFIGGFLGLAFSFILQPTYQAEAIFNSSIDFTEINYENLVGEYDGPARWTQYDEDLALQVVQRVLLGELADAYAFALTLDPTLEIQTFQKDKQIERYHALWFLRYRHEDPQVAQEIVNFWAVKSLDALHEAQALEMAETFVMVDLISKAALPGVPTYHNRNTLVLAGTMIGFLAGVIMVDFKGRFLSQQVGDE